MSSTADQIQQMVQQALRRFDELASSEMPLSQVVTEMADLVCRTVAGLGTVVWLPTDKEATRYRAVARAGHLASITIGEESGPIPQTETVIRQTLREGKAAVISPDQAEFAGTELQRTTQFMLPIDASGRFSGVMHLICTAELDPKQYRQYAAFAQQAARSLGVYLANRQTKLLRSDAASAEQILRLTRRLSETRKPADAVHELATQARQLLEASRVSAVGFWKGSSHPAFSDTPQINQRAVLVRTVQMLADTVRQRQVPMTFVRDEQLREEDLSLAPLLTELWNLGGGNVISMMPIRSDDQTIIGVLIAEYPSPEEAGRRLATQQALCQNAGPLLKHIIEWHFRPLRRTSNVLAAVHAKPIASAVKLAIALTVIAAAVWALFFMPVPVHVWADARLEPAAMQSITAPMTGRVDRVLVSTGEVIEAGQALIQLDTTDLLFEQAEALAEQQEAQLTLNTVMASQDKPEKPAEVRGAHLRLEYASARLAHIEYKIQQATITAQIDGVILTERPERLEAMTTNEGDDLLTIADLSRYDLTLEIAEDDLAVLQDSLIDTGPSEVSYIIRPWPDLTQRAVVTNTREIWPTSVPNESQTQHVFRIIVPVEPEQLPLNMDMANLTGRAKIETQPRSVAFKYGRNVWRFIKLTLLF